MRRSAAMAGGLVAARRGRILSRALVLAACALATMSNGPAVASPPPDDAAADAFTLWAAAQGQQLSDVVCLVGDSTATCYGTTTDGDAFGASASFPSLEWVALGAAPPTSGSPVPATVAAEPAVPADNDHLYIFGDIKIPAGEPGGVVIVLQGEVDGFGSIPMIVRNNTDLTVSGVSVTGTARDASGTLVATGETLSFAPQTLEPGDWAMGQLGFGLDSLTGGESLEFAVDYEEGARSFMADVVLNVIEANLLGDRIVGAVANPSQSGSSGLSQLTVACFVDGQFVDVADGFTDGDEIAPGATASFTVNLYATPCEDFAMAAAGFAM